MTEGIKKYQIILIFPPILKPEELEQTIEKIKQYIIKEEGIFSKEEGRTPSAQLKKLSYPINKYEEVFYLTLNFSILPKNIKSINQEFNMEDKLLRHIITIQDKIKIQPKETINYNKMVEKIEPLSTPEIPDKPKKEKVRKTTKAEIKDLDKKLEEILNQ